MKATHRWIALVAVALLLAVAVPVSADPPERIEEPIVLVFPDLTYGIAVFWNTTREAICQWEEGGFQGPPPYEELVTVRLKETGKGAVVGSFQALRSIEIWHLDDDADLSGPCADTDDQSGPLAKGTARVQGHDNDLFVSGTRVNAFGEHGQGNLRGADGSHWHYSWTFLAHIDRTGDFRVVVERSNLRMRGR